MDLSDIEYVRLLQSNLQAVMTTAPGVEVMKFLESLCGWYDFSGTETNDILIKHGKRQVLATIKTLLKSNPEQIVALTNKED